MWRSVWGYKISFPRRIHSMQLCWNVNGAMLKTGWGYSWSAVLSVSMSAGKVFCCTKGFEIHLARTILPKSLCRPVKVGWELCEEADTIIFWTHHAPQTPMLWTKCSGTAGTALSRGLWSPVKWTGFVGNPSEPCWGKQRWRCYQPKGNYHCASPQGKTKYQRGTAKPRTNAWNPKYSWWLPRDDLWSFTLIYFAKGESLLRNLKIRQTTKPIFQAPVLETVWGLTKRDSQPFSNQT